MVKMVTKAKKVDKIDKSKSRQLPLLTFGGEWIMDDMMTAALMSAELLQNDEED